jgi:hypothetical protein
MERSEHSDHLAGLALVAFIVSFLVPAVNTFNVAEMSAEHLVVCVARIAEGVSDPIGSGASGVWRIAAASANVLMLLAFGLYYCRQHLNAGLLAGLAFALSVMAIWALLGTAAVASLRFGCYIWLTSMVMLGFAAHLSWRYAPAGVEPMSQSGAFRNFLPIKEPPKQ